MKVVLFDLMDTLVEDPYHRMFPKDFPLRLFLRWKDRASFEEFERGEISEAEFFRRYYKPGLPDELREKLPKPKRLKKELFRFVRPIEGMIALARELSKEPGVTLGIASNYSEWYVEVLRLRRELETLFRWLFFSCELAARKPDAEYFARIEVALLRAGAIEEPADIFFVDDRSINVEAARQRGWQAIVYSSPEQTRADLMEGLADFLFQ